MAAAMGNNKSVRLLNDDEACKLFDTQARRYLRMSGTEFIRRWKTGEFRDVDTPDVIRIAMLMPLAR